MKNFKNLLILTAMAVVCSPVLGSCDAYLVGKDPVGANELGTVRVDDGNYAIVLDQSGEYSFKGIDNELYAIGAEKDGQRVILTYYFADGGKQPGKPIDIYKVLTKDIFTMSEAAEDSIGNDRINVLGAWIAGGYLNVKFGYYGSGLRSHFINMVSYPEGSGNIPVSDGTYFEFRHNDFNDGWSYWFEDYASFPLDIDIDSCGRISIGFDNYYGQKHIIELTPDSQEPDNSGIVTGNQRAKLQ